MRFRSFKMRFESLQMRFECFQIELKLLLKIFLRIEWYSIAVYVKF